MLHGIRGRVRPIWIATLTAFGLLLAVAPALAQVDMLRCTPIIDEDRIRALADVDAASLGLQGKCRVGRAKYYCAAATAALSDATNRRDPLSLRAMQGPNPGDRVCYRVSCDASPPESIEVTDPFDHRQVRTRPRSRGGLLCVPAWNGPPSTLPHSIAPLPGPDLCGPFESGAVQVLDCGGGSFFDQLSQVGTRCSPVDPALRIISIYQGISQAATVNVEETQPIVLYLTSYSTVDWTVNLAPDADVQKIIAVSYEAGTTVAEPAGTPVQILTVEETVDANTCVEEYFWGDDFGGGASEWEDPITPSTLMTAVRLTGLCMTSFHACYEASQFVVVGGP